jgi:nicotinate-nucleotide adenylyltransferase
MKLGLFGGSFDPIHRGHIEPVEAARVRLGLDRVLYLPTAQPPHKPDRRFAPALARYAMVELALLDHAALWVSDHELTLGRPAYTIETLEFLRERWTEVEIVLLIGGDSFLDLPNWRRYPEILATTRIAVMTRPGARIRDGGSELHPALLDAIAAGTVDFVENAPVDVSSSEIRRRLAAGEPLPEGWVPERVLSFARKYSLYP